MSVEDLRLYPQKFDYDCGIGAVGTALVNKGFSEVDYASLERMLLTTLEDGTDIQILPYFFSFLPEFEPKVRVNATIDDVKKEIESGRVCLVAYQNWQDPKDFGNFDSGHYGFIYGVDDKEVYILDPDPDQGKYRMKRQEFEDRWIELDEGVLYKGWMMSLSLK